MPPAPGPVGDDGPAAHGRHCRFVRGGVWACPCGLRLRGPFNGVSLPRGQAWASPAAEATVGR